MKPQGRRRLVSFFQEAFGLSRRRACVLSGISRSVVEYQPRRRDDGSLRERILAWARERTRYGYRRIHLLLQREGWVVNRKRVYRIYREEALSVRRRRRKQVAAAPREAMPVPTRANERWSIDFMADTLADARTFRTLNLVDDYNRHRQTDRGRRVDFFVHNRVSIFFWISSSCSRASIRIARSSTT